MPCGVSYGRHISTARTSPAQREFAALRALASKLPEPAATLLKSLNDRDVIRLGQRLLPYAAVHGDSPALSPSRSPAPTVPVFLLHGLHDTVIPAVESRYLAGRLRGLVPVRLLLTDLVSHGEADQPARVLDVLRLASLWGDILAR
jgi:pimeloyl-ACP methyl ester carboxylesterase